MIGYTPGPISARPEQLSTYVQEELRKIANVIGQLAAGHFDVTYVEPTKPREGDIRLAAGSVEDAAHWSPDGSGDRTLYQYRQTSLGVFAWVAV